MLRKFLVKKFVIGLFALGMLFSLEPSISKKCKERLSSGEERRGEDRIGRSGNDRHI